ncbi:hypothetical protein BOX15_Mlig031071g2 [Macrostomum lignano]|uniref:Uncharacterized protein n=1 Tax=Macrostomum lignano TaxID=282301 RepID=A0A267EA06_9PLAT|nr:hypothetical protein BOX15_Mlig031071g2 [Macrostomum lignano]
MPAAVTPFEQFSKAESHLIKRLGRHADERIFELSTWESADRDLLGLFPAISSALTVLNDDQKQRHESATSPDDTQRSSPCSLTGSSSSDSSGASSSSYVSAFSASSRSSAGGAASPNGQKPAAARWCQPGLKDLQLLASKEDVASLPRASSIEEVLALLSKDDVIVVPCAHGGYILYAVTYLDDLVAQQPPTVIPPSPDDPATKLSPEVFQLVPAERGAAEPRTGRLAARSPACSAMPAAFLELLQK